MDENKKLLNLLVGKNCDKKVENTKWISKTTLSFKKDIEQEFLNVFYNEFKIKIHNSLRELSDNKFSWSEFKKKLNEDISVKQIFILEALLLTEKYLQVIINGHNLYLSVDEKVIIGSRDTQKFLLSIGINVVEINNETINKYKKQFVQAILKNSLSLETITHPQYYNNDYNSLNILALLDEKKYTEINEKGFNVEKLLEFFDDDKSYNFLKNIKEQLLLLPSNMCNFFNIDEYRAKEALNTMTSDFLVIIILKQIKKVFESKHIKEIINKSNEDLNDLFSNLKSLLRASSKSLFEIYDIFYNDFVNKISEYILNNKINEIEEIKNILSLKSNLYVEIDEQNLSSINKINEILAQNLADHILYDLYEEGFDVRCFLNDSFGYTNFSVKVYDLILEMAFDKNIQLHKKSEYSYSIKNRINRTFIEDKFEKYKINLNSFFNKIPEEMKMISYNQVHENNENFIDFIFFSNDKIPETFTISKLFKRFFEILEEESNNKQRDDLKLFLQATRETLLTCNMENIKNDNKDSSKKMKI